MILNFGVQPWLTKWINEILISRQVISVPGTELLRIDISQEEFLSEKFLQTIGELMKSVLKFVQSWQKTAI